MSNQQFDTFVLAIYPSTRGLAFVLFEGPESPFDWGTKEFRGLNRNAHTLEAIKQLIDRYRPEALIIADFTEHGSRRSVRIRSLYRSLIHLGQVECVDVLRYSREQVRQCFNTVGATSKYEIATTIARQIPAFSHRLPGVRKPWMSEDVRQNLFDAAALALTHYNSRVQGDCEPPEF